MNDGVPHSFARSLPSLSAKSVSRRSLLQAGLAASTTLLLSGCAGRGGGAGDPLEFWNFYAPTTQSQPDVKAQNDWFINAIGDWNQANDQQIRPVFIPAYTDPTNTRLATAFASNAGPDIFLISPGDFLRYYNGGVLEDLTPYMSEEAIADFPESTLSTRSVDGRIFAIPMEVEPLAMFYSRPAWEAAGLSEGDIPTTWDQMLDVAETLSTPTQSGLVFETVPGYYQNFTWYPWMWQGGGEVVDPITQRAAFRGDAVTGALNLFGDAISRGVAPRTLPAAGDIPGAFTEGFAATWQSGIWNVAGFEANAPDFDYGVFPMPPPSTGATDVRTALGGWSFCVNSRGRNPEAAAKFVVETVGSMSEASIARVTEWCSVAKSDMPPRRSVERRMQENGVFDDPRRAGPRGVRDVGATGSGPGRTRSCSSSVRSSGCSRSSRWSGWSQVRSNRPRRFTARHSCQSIPRWRTSSTCSPRSLSSGTCSTVFSSQPSSRSPHSSSIPWRHTRSRGCSSRAARPSS